MEEKLISVFAIKQRGWSDSMVKKFLGEADKLIPNPHYKCAAPMRLYNEQRVIAVESSTEFASYKAKYSSRKVSAEKALKTKRDKAIAYAQSISVDVPVLEWDNVLYCAINAYNDFHDYMGHDYDRAGEWSDPQFLARICRNYLRHECTDYDDHLDKMYGLVGVQEAHDIIQKKINDRINELYPEILRLAS